MQRGAYNELDRLPRGGWLVRGILKTGRVSVWYGPPNCGKTTILLDVAQRVASDLSECYGQPIEQRGSVAWIAGEWPDNVNDMIHGHWKEFGLEQLYPMQVLGRSVNISDAGTVDQIIEDLRSAVKPLWLVVIDTLSKNFGDGDPDKTADMQRFIQQCGRIVEAFGCAVVIIHHEGHQKGRARNSSVLGGDAADVWHVTGKNGAALLQSEKMKGKAAGPFAFVIKQSDAVRYTEGGEIIEYTYPTAHFLKVITSAPGSDGIDDIERSLTGAQLRVYVKIKETGKPILRITLIGWYAEQYSQGDTKKAKTNVDQAIRKLIEKGHIAVVGEKRGETAYEIAPSV